MTSKNFPIYKPLLIIPGIVKRNYETERTRT